MPRATTSTSSRARILTSSVARLRRDGFPFHKLGVNARQASDLAKWWGEVLTAGKAANDEGYLARADDEMAALRQKWGNAADGNEEIPLNAGSDAVIR